MIDVKKIFFDYPWKRFSIWLHVIVLSLISLALLIPFLDKAFHIDDSLFLDLGNFFFDGIDNYYKKTYYYYGLRHENVLNSSHSPLGLPPLNFLIYFLFENPGEKVFHLIYSIFSVSAVIFTYIFFLRFSTSPFILSLLFLLTPPFILLSNNIMTDICFYAFLLGSFVFYISGTDKNCWKSILISVFLFTIAIAVSYQSVVFYPLFFICSYLKKKDTRYFYWMFASLLPILCWYLYHYFIIWELPNPFNLKLPYPVDKALTLKLKLIYYLMNLGLSFFSPIILIIYSFKKQLGPLYLISFVFSFILFMSIDDFILNGYSVTQKIIMLIFFSFSIYIVLNMLYRFAGSLSRKLENSDELFLLSWFLFFFAICILFTPFGTNRYLLPLIPPLLILLANKIKFNRLIFLYLLLMVIFSLRIAAADYNYANSYKSFARNVKNKVSSTGTIWFTGEWGFRHYMTEEGYKYLTYDSVLKKNDLIIKPQLNSPIDLGKLDILLNLEKNFSIDSREKLKILSLKSKAGFYSHGFGFFPFWFNDGPLEYFEVYKVKNVNLFKTADQSFQNIPAGEITDKNTIGQTFISRTNNLSVIKVLLASYARQNTAEVTFHLKNHGNKLEDIAKIVVPAFKIEDNAWHSFNFPPLPDSKGKTYYFYLESPNAKKGNASTAWMSSTDKYKSGTFMRNHLPEKGDLTFVTLASKEELKKNH